MYRASRAAIWSFSVPSLISRCKCGTARLSPTSARACTALLRMLWSSSAVEGDQQGLVDGVASGPALRCATDLAKGLHGHVTHLVRGVQRHANDFLHRVAVPIGTQTLQGGNLATWAWARARRGAPRGKPSRSRPAQPRTNGTGQAHRVRIGALLPWGSRTYLSSGASAAGAPIWPSAHAAVSRHPR